MSWPGRCSRSGSGPLYDLNELGDSASAAIAIGKLLIADSQRVLGPDHPDTLTAQNKLVVACQEAGRG